MAYFGYARVSSRDQDLTIQLDALKKFGCSTIRSEKASATTRQNRIELETLLEFIRSEDSLVVTKIDRLARSTLDLLNIVNALKSKGAHLVVVDQNIDTSTSAGIAFLQMLAVFAEFETNLRKERQLDGIKKAKESGGYLGRKKSIDDKQILALKQDGLKISEITNILNISRASVYRALAEKRTS
jgi:DNA invertase Pin-like site-specific DNA recombinase